MGESQQVHFSDSEWADHVRGLVSDEKSRMMRRHLQSGCSSCGETVRWLEDLARLGRVDPPESLTKELEARARSVFSRGDRAETTGLRVAAHGWTIDVNIEVEADSIRLLGRLNRESAVYPLANIAVHLISSSGDFRETRSDATGNFSIADFPAGVETTLRIMLAEGVQDVVVPPVDMGLRQGA